MTPDTGMLELWDLDAGQAIAFGGAVKVGALSDHEIDWTMGEDVPHAPGIVLEVVKSGNDYGATATRYGLSAAGFGSGTSRSSASITLTAGRILVVVVETERSGSSADATSVVFDPAGQNIALTKLTSGSVDADHRAQVWSGARSISGSGVVTVTMPASCIGYSITTLEIVDPAGTGDTDWCNVKTAGSGTGTTASVSLGSIGAHAAGLAMFFKDTVAEDFVPEQGLVPFSQEIDMGGNGTPLGGSALGCVAVAWIGSDEDTTMSATMASSDWLAVGLEVLEAAAIVQMNKIGPSTSIFNPKVTQQVVIPTITLPTSVKTPSLTQTVKIPAIAALTSLFNPSILGSQFVVMNKIGPMGSVFSPKVTQTVKIPVITSLTSLFNPKVIQQQFVPMNKIGATGTLFQPQVVAGGSIVALNKIGPTGVLFNPAVSPGSVTVVMQKIGPSTSMFSPALTTGTFVSMNKIGPTSALFQMTVLPSAVSVLMQKIGPTHSLFTPVVQATNLVSLQKIGPNSVLYQPSIQQLVQMQKISATPVVFNPDLIQQLLVTLPAIGPNTIVFAPSILGGYVIVYGSGSYTPTRFGDGAYGPEVSGSGSHSPTRIGSGRGTV
jgi:hypothetical protein